MCLLHKLVIALGVSFTYLQISKINYCLCKVKFVLIFSTDPQKLTEMFLDIVSLTKSSADMSIGKQTILDIFCRIII